MSDADAKSKKIYAICDEWPPYQVMENGHLSGFSTKIVEIVFERMGLTLEPIDVFPWKRAMHMVENGEADALFSSNYTKERAAFAYYPEEPIVDSPWVMWTRREDNLDFSSFNDLFGKRIGIVRGYSYTEELLDFVKAHKNYEEVHNDETNLKKLNAGRVDFAPAELGNGFYLVRKLQLNKIVPIVTNPLKIDGLYIIFNKNKVKKSIVDKFSSELKKLKEEPLYKDLYEEYFNF